MEVLEFNENNGFNNYYVVRDLDERLYVVMHIVNGKFAIYDHEFHDVVGKFRWNPNNGYACTILRREHLESVPDLEGVFEIDRMVHMHVLIKKYCMNECDEEGVVVHHINGRLRDNRKENLIRLSINQHRALMKPSGVKLYKPPVELRNVAPVLPEFCKWINAKKAFRMEGHPACFAAVERGQQPHKYIESLKGKKHNLVEKYKDFMVKYDALMNEPFGGQNSYWSYLDFKNKLENQFQEIVCCARRVAMANLDISASPSTHEPDIENT